VEVSEIRKGNVARTHIPIPCQELLYLNFTCVLLRLAARNQKEETPSG